MGKYLDKTGLAFLIKKMKNADILNEQKITNLQTNHDTLRDEYNVTKGQVELIIGPNNKINEAALPASITGALNFVGEFMFKSTDIYESGDATVDNVFEFDSSILNLIDESITTRPDQIQPEVLFEIFAGYVQLKSSLPDKLQIALKGSYVIVNTKIEVTDPDLFMGIEEIKVGDWLIINNDGKVIKLDNTLPTSMTEAEVQEIYNSTSSDY